MKADPADLTKLLEIQSLDSALEHLKHKAATLGVHQAINELMKQRGDAKESLIAAKTILSDAEAAAERAEADVVPVRERLARNQARVDAGQMDSKALSSAIEEIEHLKARVRDLEDAQLEAMEAVDQASADLGELIEKQSEIERDLREQVDARDAIVADLAAQADALVKSKTDLAARTQSDLVALYEKIKTRSNGVGVARFEGRRCLGCELEATVADYNNYLAAAPDEVIRCTECTRILVRPI